MTYFALLEKLNLVAADARYEHVHRFLFQMRKQLSLIIYNFQGDSGSGLIRNNVVIGVHVFSFLCNCCKTRPDGYTSVLRHKPWIRRILMGYPPPAGIIEWTDYTIPLDRIHSHMEELWPYECQTYVA